MPGLILIPTAGERDAIEARLQVDAEHWSIETIGFGVIAAAVSTARLLAQHPRSQVILAGIAGLFPSTDSIRFQVGDAAWFRRVCIDGIGVGQGDAFIDADQMGWSWYPSIATDRAIECIPPTTADRTTLGAPDAMLLSVCSASVDDADRLRRSKRFPSSIGEDMESFAVAYACHQFNVPMRIVRGFSNIVGQRDKSKWQIQSALTSVAKQVQLALDEDHK